MLNYGFKNHTEYQDLFGFRETGDGKLVRRNKILLSFLRNKLSHTNENIKDLLECVDLQVLSSALISRIAEKSKGWYYITLFGMCFKNNTYQSDDTNGVCVDGDISQYRYINQTTNKIYKMKVAKLFAKVNENNDVWKCLPEQIRTYLCEYVANQYRTNMLEKQDRYKLTIDTDFEKIYSYRYCDGYFDSCMQGKGNWYFYRESIDAHAAYITDSTNGLIVARCIIYDKVYNDDESKVYRLAERQYATDGDNTLKTLLVQMLIKEGAIDGYKKIGVDCHANDAYLDINDNPIDERLHITNTLESGNSLSYQDSFIYYDIDEHKAYNRHRCGVTHELDTTDAYFEDDRYYDEYHDEYCDEIEEVIYHGIRIYCDANRLDDFVWIENQYYHYEDLYRCERCDDYYLPDDAYYSEITDEYYCCESCRDLAEREYKIDYWYYSEYDDEYFEDEDDVIGIYIFDHKSGKYDFTTIYRLSLEDEDYIEFACDIYLGYDKETQQPYNFIGLC